MSADNTILILKLKDEYRVGHFQAVENLYWMWHNQDSSEPVSVRLFEFFNNLDSIPDRSTALAKASNLYDNIGYVEYGIQTILVNKTWEDIVVEAKQQALKEIEYVLESTETENWDFERKTDAIDDLRRTLREINNWIIQNG